MTLSDFLIGHGYDRNCHDDMLQSQMIHLNGGLVTQSNLTLMRGDIVSCKEPGKPLKKWRVGIHTPNFDDEIE